VSLLERWHRERREADASLNPAHVIERCRQHITDLCRKHSITVTFDNDLMRGKAFRLRRAMSVPPIRSRWTYATALHELGHLMMPCEASHRRVTRHGHTACGECEVQAWQWAKANSVVGWSAEMQSNLEDALPSYLRHAQGDAAWQIHAMANTPLARRKAQLERAKRRTFK